MYLAWRVVRRIPQLHDSPLQVHVQIVEVLGVCVVVTQHQLLAKTRLQASKQVIRPNI